MAEDPGNSTQGAEANPSNALRMSSRVSALPGIGKAKAAAFARLEIRTIADLLRHLPMRYELESAETSIEMLTADTIGSCRGTVVNTRYIRSGRGGRFVATLEDHSARLNLVWFNAGYMRNRLHPGAVVRVQGKVGSFNGYPQMVNAKFENIDADEERDGFEDDRLRPIYPATEKLPSAQIEQVIESVLPVVLPSVSDPLPTEFLARREMPSLAEAYRLIHQPLDMDDVGVARRRLAFNELLLLQLGIQIKRYDTRTRLAAPALGWSEAIDGHIRERFPFELTDAQDKVVNEIAADLQQSKPMNRLLQGDVGAGKTVVALYALLMAVVSRKQATLMAPTELLAEQHYLSITRMLEGSNVRVALLTAGQAGPNTAARQALLEQIEGGELDIIIGTQAILTDAVRFKDLAVAVIDEQHRFGVMQRAKLRGQSVASDASVGKHAGQERMEFKGEGSGTQLRGIADEANADQPDATDTAASDGDERIPAPHILVMTATPIPRTLSLTIFGDLDVSTIHGLPPGRQPIATRVVSEHQSDDVYGYIAKRLARGEQCYVVVPAIDSENQDDNEPQLKSVKEHAELLRQRYFGDYKVAMVHGRLKREEREVVMASFRDNRTQVLVATTVIEVGVDVPNATIMVVEHAERFGLAQLHQLRGRVGRGDTGRRSLCVFIADPVTDDASKRMEAIAGTTDGFRIAEKDLEIRGMGDFFGTRQHGMPPLRVARIPEDMDLLQLARRDAVEFVEADPYLQSDEHKLLHQVLWQQYGDALGLIDVG